MNVPHAGFHGTLGIPKSQPFFEGWYTRVQVPQQEIGFAWMLAIEDAASGRGGGLIQVLGSIGEQEDLHWRSIPGIQGFWADPDRLAFGHWGTAKSPSPQLLPPEQFFDTVQTGYQLTQTLHQGIFTNPVSQAVTRWSYRIEPVYTYGIPAQATMGIFSYLPVFEPGWQILMAQGWATGWVEWQGQRYLFERAPAYSEKNWGSAFPARWFWISCNTFPDRPDLSLTCVGSRRGVLWWEDEVGMVALHGCLGSHPGTTPLFLDWKPETSQMSWQVDPWGSWQVEARGPAGILRLSGHTERTGTAVMTPSLMGMQYGCRDTLRGSLRMQWWRQEGQVWVKELDITSESACLEVGGTGTQSGWEHQM